jgi:hypothetical protein
MRKSLAVLLLAAMVIMVCTSVMADTWQVTAINDAVPADGIELTLGGTGGGITDPVAVYPSPLSPPFFVTVTFTSPPPGNELDASFAPAIILPGQSFVADFTLPTGDTPSFIFGTWTSGGGPVGGVNPFLTTFADIAVPEPSTMVLACLAATGLTVLSLRRRRNCNMGTR